MGGCLSVPDTVHGQPQQQPGGAPMPKSLCRRGWDSIMECLFSRWCAGEFNNSTVKTTWIPPTDDQDFIPGRRAISSRDAENSPRGVTAAITGSRDPGSDLIHRWDLQEKHMSEAEHRRKLQKAINLSDGDNSDNARSNPLGDTDTSLVENAPKGVTSASTSQNRQDRVSDWIDRLTLDPKMQELHKSQTGKGKGITLIDSDNSDNKRSDPLGDNSDIKRSNPLGDTNTSLVENAPKGVTAASTIQDSQDRGSDLIDRLTLDLKMQELHKSQTGRGKGITLIDSDNSDNKKSDLLGDNSDNKRSDPLGEPDTCQVENSQKGVTASNTSQDSQGRGSDFIDILDPNTQELLKSTGGEQGTTLIDGDNSENKRSNPLGDNSDNGRSNPLGDTDTSLVENALKGDTAASTSQDRGSDFFDMLDPKIQELLKSQTGKAKGITLIDSDNSENKRSNPLGDNSDNGRSNPLGDTDTSLVEKAPKGVTAASTSQDRGSDLIDRLDQEMQELFKSQTGGEKRITLSDSDDSDNERSGPLGDNSDNKRSNPLCDSDTALVENSQKGVTAAITDSRDSQDRGSEFIYRLDLEMQELLKSQTEGEIDSGNSDNGRSNLLGGANTSLVEELTNAEAVTTVTREDKKGASASNPNEATGVGSEIARKNEDPSSDKMEIK